MIVLLYSSLPLERAYFNQRGSAVVRSGGRSCHTPRVARFERGVYLPLRQDERVLDRRI